MLLQEKIIKPTVSSPNFLFFTMSYSENKPSKSSKKKDASATDNPLAAACLASLKKQKANKPPKKSASKQQMVKSFAQALTILVLRMKESRRTSKPQEPSVLALLTRTL